MATNHRETLDRHCRYCALFHTEGAKLHGATDDEIAEASMMGGMTMAASSFIGAQQVDRERFAEETKEIIAFVKKTMKSGKGRGAEARA